MHRDSPSFFFWNRRPYPALSIFLMSKRTGTRLEKLHPLTRDAPAANGADVLEGAGDRFDQVGLLDRGPPTTISAAACRFLAQAKSELDGVEAVPVVAGVDLDHELAGGNAR